MSRKFLLIGAAVTLLVVMRGASGGVLAADWPRLETGEAGGVEYVNGGFGIEERAAMPEGYPLKVIFATDKGHLLSNVAVKIFDEAGDRIFEMTADDGPWLLVRLNPGRYRIEALHNGYARSLFAVDVPARGTKTVLISWKTTEVDMGLEE